MKESITITIVVIALGAWGKGDTYEAALAKCIEAGGRQNTSNMHIVYACTDPVSPGTPKPATCGHPKPATCGHPKTSH